MARQRRDSLVGWYRLDIVAEFLGLHRSSLYREFQRSGYRGRVIYTGLQSLKAGCRGHKLPYRYPIRLLTLTDAYAIYQARKARKAKVKWFWVLS